MDRAGDRRAGGRPSARPQPDVIGGLRLLADCSLNGRYGSAGNRFGAVEATRTTLAVTDPAIPDITSASLLALLSAD